MEPPQPGAPRPLHFPSAKARTLENGLRVLAIEQRHVPLIAAHLVVQTGGAADPPRLAGLGSMTSALLTHGTQRLSSTEIADAIDALGARLGASSSYDACSATVHAVSPKFEEAFALFSEVVREPAFSEEEFERARAKALSDLQLTYSNPSALARLVAARVVFGAGPYGHPLAGTAQTLQALTREAVADTHRRYYRPDNAILVIGGDCDAERAFELAREAFGEWRPALVAPTPTLRSGPLPNARCVIVDKPDSGRTSVALVAPSIARQAPDYEAGIVATAILSGYSGRLNREVRVKRGLSYGAGAQLNARRDGGLFLATTLVDHTKVVEGSKVVIDTVESMSTDAADADELATRKTVVIGNYTRSIDTIDGIVGALADLAFYGLPLDLSTFSERVAAIDKSEVETFAQRHLTRDLSLVLVGDARVFGREMRGDFPALEIIPAAELDLSTAALR